MLTILYRASFAAALLLEISDYFHGKEKKAYCLLSFSQVFAFVALDL